MTFETFVEEMLEWFPFLHEQCSAYMDDGEPLAYIALGAVLVPWLGTRLEAHDVVNIAKVGSFLEVAAAAGRSDKALNDLIGIEIGEWLPEVQERKLLLSYLGPETHRVCSYHISRLPG